MEPPVLLVAPAAFKGTLSPVAAATVMARALRRLPDWHVYTFPTTDGGTGTVDCLLASDPDFQVLTCPDIVGPLPQMRVSARILLHPTRALAVVAACEAHGLHYLPHGFPLAPLRATSYGVGQLIHHAARALQAACSADSAARQTPTLVVTLGGSASTDGGIGALQALGWECRTVYNQLLTEPLGGGDLVDVWRVVPPAQCPTQGIQIRIATDVLQPLLGARGTARTFAPQKGASPEEVAFLEASLGFYAHLWQRTGLIPDVTYRTEAPGSGAAGGLGFGLSMLPESQFVSGFDWFADTSGLKRVLAEASAIFAGEGRLDATSLEGKALGHLIAESRGRPVWLFCGNIADGLALPPNIHAVSLRHHHPDPLHHPEEALEEAVTQYLPKIKASLLGDSTAQSV
jgi:glycerate kinase